MILTFDAPEIVVLDMGVVESAFGQKTYDTTAWWYAAVVENPNPGHVFSLAKITVEAYDAGGVLLDSSSNYINALPGRFAVNGSFLSVGQSVIDHIEIRGPVAAEAAPVPSEGVGTFSITEVAATSDDYLTTVSGVVSGTFAAEQGPVAVTVIAKNSAGQIIRAESTYVERVPVGTRVRFEAVFWWA